MMRMSNRIAGPAVAMIMAIVLLPAKSPSVMANTRQASPAPAEVKIDSFSFGPETLTVAVGTTVTWINHDDTPHKVVSAGEVFKSKVLDTAEKFSYTFTKSGTYPYFCSIHPKMTGTVVAK